LNEPFRAEIEVNALQDDEQGNLEVRLGSSQDFERAGLERSFLLTQLNFEVIEESDSTRILVTSDIPIKEPFLGFLLAATTGQGKLLREYMVLLDPPVPRSWHCGFTTRTEYSINGSCCSSHNIFKSVSLYI
jgi:pilus assembly protein FimV